MSHLGWPPSFPVITIPFLPLTSASASASASTSASGEEEEDEEEGRTLLKATFAAVHMVDWEGEQWLQGACNYNDSTGR
jgi:hypothetical protein